MYLSDHSKNLISAEEKVAELIKQREQLRNELAAEQARLDWLEKKTYPIWMFGNQLDVPNISLKAAAPWASKPTLREAIDVAMKEGAK